MQILDYLILFIYGAGILLVGSILSKKNRTAADMFAVKKQSPWWLSGLSAFMSAFSAGTFVVWGGIAFKHGLVAVSILMCSGISSFLVGRFIAGKWASLGITTVGEYLQLRFGKASVQFYTWVGMLFKIVAMGVALYSFAVLFSSLIRPSEGSWFADAETGNLSVSFAIVISGALMLAYAISGGLWAVLIIDSIQFVVLTCIVLFVVPLCISKVGGWQQFIQSMPDGFLSPTGGGFTWYFLIGWIMVHTFKLGGEWVFIQRFLAVSSPANARKSSYLFGSLYLISPIIWMLPPMLYRSINPSAPPEQSYIMACAAVLPAGMVGLLLAAMFSSAASYIDGEVNVYAGAVTNDIYKVFVNPGASEKKLVLIGRISSFVIGGTIMLIALSIPFLGGAEQVILTMTSLLVVAMVLPVLWGLYFSKLRQNAIWISTGITFILAFYMKVLLPSQSSNAIVRFYQSNMKIVDVSIGLLVPLFSLSVLEFMGGKSVSGFLAVQQSVINKANPAPVILEKSILHYPAKIIGYSMCTLSVLMFGLLFASDHSYRFLIALFAGLLMMIGISIQWAIKRS